MQEEMEKMEAKHRQHDKLKHPMTKDQLEEVWEEQDHMEAKVGGLLGAFCFLLRIRKTAFCQNKLVFLQCCGSALVFIADPDPTLYLNADPPSQKLDFDMKNMLYEGKCVIKHTYVGTEAILKGWK